MTGEAIEAFNTITAQRKEPPGGDSGLPEAATPIAIGAVVLVTVVVLVVNLKRRR